MIVNMAERKQVGCPLMARSGALTQLFPDVEKQQMEEAVKQISNRNTSPALPLWHYSGSNAFDMIKLLFLGYSRIWRTTRASTGAGEKHPSGWVRGQLQPWDRDCKLSASNPSRVSQTQNSFSSASLWRCDFAVWCVSGRICRLHPHLYEICAGW